MSTKSWRAQEHDIGALGDEVQLAQVGDQLPLHRALGVEVELLQGLGTGNAISHLSFRTVLDVDRENPGIRRLAVQRRLLARRRLSDGVSE